MTARPSSLVPAGRREGPVLSFVFPYPPAALSPNARVHWAPKSRAVKDYRGYCGLVAKGQARTVHYLWRKAVATVAFRVRDPDRRRDADNALAMLKPLWDGLTDATILWDDRGLRALPAETFWIKGDWAVLVEIQEER